MTDSPVYNFGKPPEGTRVIVIGNVQVIMATHSVFALQLADANFIDMSPGYTDSVRHTMATCFG